MLPFVEAMCVRAFSVAILIFACLPFPTRDAFIKAFGRYFDFVKKTGKKFTVYGQSVRIWVGHICSLSANLIKASGDSRLSSLFILYMKQSYATRREVCHL